MLFFAAYTFSINTIYTIEIKLSNPLSIEAQIDNFYLLTDCDKIDDTFELSDYCSYLEIVDFKPFTIASNTNDYMLNVNVKSKQLGKYKLIGYIINSFNGLSKILFSDLIKDCNNNDNKSQNDCLNVFYNIEVIPKLPVIDYICLKNCDNRLSSNRDIVELTNTDNTIIECYTGEG